MNKLDARQIANLFNMTNTTTTMSLITATPQPQDPTASSLGLIIGASLGGSVIFLLLAGMFLYYRRRKMTADALLARAPFHELLSQTPSPQPPAVPMKILYVHKFNAPSMSETLLVQAGRTHDTIVTVDDDQVGAGTLPVPATQRENLKTLKTNAEVAAEVASWTLAVHSSNTPSTQAKPSVHINTQPRRHVVPPPVKTVHAQFESPNRSTSGDVPPMTSPGSASATPVTPANHPITPRCLVVDVSFRNALPSPTSTSRLARDPTLKPLKSDAEIAAELATWTNYPAPPRAPTSTTCSPSQAPEDLSSNSSATVRTQYDEKISSKNGEEPRPTAFKVEVPMGKRVAGQEAGWVSHHARIPSTASSTDKPDSDHSPAWILHPVADEKGGVMQLTAASPRATARRASLIKAGPPQQWTAAQVVTWARREFQISDAIVGFLLGQDMSGRDVARFEWADWASGVMPQAVEDRVVFWRMVKGFRELSAAWEGAEVGDALPAYQ